MTNQNANKIKLPASSHKKAILVVDVVEKSINDNSKPIIKNILQLLSTLKYEAYIIAEYTDKVNSMHAMKKNKWLTQFKKLETEEETIEAIKTKIAAKKPYNIVKTTRSVFGNTNALASYLKKKDIRELHIVGLETHDCILATALDAFDFGFITLVIEEACGAKMKQLHESGLSILQKLNLTNHTIDL
ncbi:MAG TPA: isochorismatase family cysteine hydrolase [Saprospiraceae bacterium]|nr:isochorismatase family cysteine hydrolase [Saprospiraceae bacterium]